MERDHRRWTAAPVSDVRPETGLDPEPEPDRVQGPALGPGPDLDLELVLGIDAGGTRTRALLAHAVPGPEAIGTGLGGPGNALAVPPELLVEHLAQAIAGAVPSEMRGRVGAVAGGFAGAPRVPADGPGRKRAAEALRAACGRVGLTPSAVEVCSDVEAAFAGAPGTPADGLALVAGTGAVAVRIASRVAVATADGNGWLIGDEGGGFWLGREALRAARRAADGRGPSTTLHEAVAEALLRGPADGPEEWSDALRGGIAAGGVGREGASGGRGPDLEASQLRPGAAAHPDQGLVLPDAVLHDPEEYRARLIAAAMAVPPTRLAGLAPLVVEAAAAGDAVAGDILGRAADHLAATLRALRPRPGESLVATGGLLVSGANGRGALTDRLLERLAPLGLRTHWVADGLPGAVALARLALRRG